MLRIGRGLGMATGTREHRVIRGVGMARRTDSVRIAVVDREERMVARRQRRRNPSRRCVASLTGRRPARGHVIGICGPGKVRLMARVAGRRRPCVDVVYVALYAVNSSVGPGQRKWRVVVIERRTGPGRRCMARVTGSRKASRRVVRVGGPVPVRCVAAIAGCGQCGEVVVRVALRAGKRGVSTS